MLCPLKWRLLFLSGLLTRVQYLFPGAWAEVKGLGNPTLLPLWTAAFANLEPGYTPPASERWSVPLLLSGAEPCESSSPTWERAGTLLRVSCLVVNKTLLSLCPAAQTEFTLPLWPQRIPRDKKPQWPLKGQAGIGRPGCEQMPTPEFGCQLSWEQLVGLSVRKRHWNYDTACSKPTGET